MGLVVPAVLPHSKRDLEETLELFETLGEVSRVQIDVVDGRFASPTSWPCIAPEELQAMRGSHLPHVEKREYEIDLMCQDPLSLATEWVALGASRLIFHAESSPDIARILTDARRKFGHIIAIGLAINVASDFALIDQNIERIDFVQVMGIATIGRQGQPFEPRTVERVRTLRARYDGLPIQVDGGVTLESAKKLLGAGVSSLVVGSGILKARDPRAAFAAFENLENPFGV